MPSADLESSKKTFFDDFPRQSSRTMPLRQSIVQTSHLTEDTHTDDAVSKAKRTACVLCRKRKLRCDGARPSCGTCKRLFHDCLYDEVRSRSGPKKGYVKLLEARLQKVEKLLKNQNLTHQNKDTPSQSLTPAYTRSTTPEASPDTADNLDFTDQALVSFSAPISPRLGPLASGLNALPTNRSTDAIAGMGDLSWEKSESEMDETLPPSNVTNDLYDLFFTKIHPSTPILHQRRFMADMNVPPMCLRYILWALATSVTDKYDALQEDFYQRARRYAQMDEMKGHGESMTTLAHCQTWILMATYEFKQMYFRRAWLSAGRAVRLAQMMQLHQLDRDGDATQGLPPSTDWTEREERRRAFWMAFCIDRYFSIAAGWPMTIEERDIMTNLPSSEEAFENGKSMQTGSLHQAVAPGGSANLQPFGGVVLTAALLGRNFLHLHRPSPDDHDDDLDGAFWTRHRAIETILLNTGLGLPDHLRLPSGLLDPNVIFLNMSLHTSTICLHQGAIFRADTHPFPANFSNESKIRCVTAAMEVTSLMRMISHMDLAAMNPFMAFCIYVAARVFVQYLKTRPKDQQMESSLQFLHQAMQALRRKNPLTQSFLVQLDLDIESAGVLGLRPNAGTQPNLGGPMDRSPDYSDHTSPATVSSKSRGTSISYGASRSPGQHLDERPNGQSLASPPNGRSERMPTRQPITPDKAPFLSISEDMFSANVYNPPLMDGDSLHGGFMADDYNMTTMNPDLSILEGSWNLMQDEVNHPSTMLTYRDDF